MERVSVIRKTDPPDSRPHVSISNPGPRKVVNRVRTSQSDQTRGAASDGSRGQQFASATRSRGQQLTPSAPARGQQVTPAPMSGQQQQVVSQQVRGQALSICCAHIRTKN